VHIFIEPQLWVTQLSLNKYDIFAELFSWPSIAAKGTGKTSLNLPDNRDKCTSYKQFFFTFLASKKSRAGKII
jgi:hypothetical protein